MRRWSWDWNFVFFSDPVRAAESFALLNIEQQKLLLTTKALDVEQKEAILTTSALTKNEAGLLATATTSGLTLEEGKQIIATSADSAAKKEATISTFSLSGAYRGLATSIGITTTALSLWIAGNTLKPKNSPTVFRLGYYTTIFVQNKQSSLFFNMYSEHIRYILKQKCFSLYHTASLNTKFPSHLNYYLVHIYISLLWYMNSKK